jgi:predicted nucleic acid-binding protein
MADRLRICAPSLLEYEIINGLVIAQRRGRINLETILPAVEGFFNLDIPLSGVDSFFSRMMVLCQTFNLSVYDASYVALAEQEKIPLITADSRLYHSVNKKISWVKWIGDSAL